MGLKSNMAAAIVGATLLGGAGIAAASSVGGSATSSSSAGAPVVNAAPAGPSTAPTSCLGRHDDGWPPAVDGRPEGFDAGDPGVYLWHDSDGWHLRVTHVNDNAKLYTGAITTDGTLTGQPVKLEKDDHFFIGPDDHRLVFSFVNYGGIDGVDFQTSCARGLHFSFQLDGHELVTAALHIGADGHHPAEIPFTALRQV